MSIMPQESEQDVIDRLRLWNAMRDPAPLVKLSSVREVLADALIVMDAIRFRESKLQAVLRKEWQPIETAPKDGTELLGFRADCGVLLIRWTAPDEFCTESECEQMGAESAEKFDWFCADFIAGSRLEGDESPTHWQPLPSPPHPIGNA